MQKYKKALRMHHSPLWFDIISMAFHFKINMFYIFQLNDKWGCIKTVVLTQPLISLVI